MNNFDYQFYINYYSDLKKDGITTEKKALQHYIKNGIKEGRLINDKLLSRKYSEEDYINTEHFNKFTFSLKELIRIKNYNEQFYKLSYNDVPNDSNECFEHFLKYGIKENRKANRQDLIEFYNKELNEIIHQNNLEENTIEITDEYNKFYILIRTSNRPEYFKNCIESIFNQNYTNYEIIICYDDDESLNYLSDLSHENITYFRVFKNHQFKYFFNLYCNELLEKVNVEDNNYIIFLDDDDRFIHNNSLKIINSFIENDSILIWKFLRPDKNIFPKDFNNLTKGDFGSCSCCFNAKYKDLVQWTPIQGGDFDFFTNLSKFLKIKPLELTLTTTCYNDRVSNYGNNIDF